MTAVGEIFRIKALVGNHVGRQTRLLSRTETPVSADQLGLGELIQPELERLDHQMKVSVGSEVRRAIGQPWQGTTQPIAPPDDIPAAIYFSVEVARLYCGRCERIEAFRSVFLADVLRPSFGLYSHGKHPAAATQQTFVLTLACQVCCAVGVPETFLIERRADHLQLCGRAPMEQLPPVEGVPKDDQKLLQNARIARNSGQVLGAIALLRCFLEQYARRQTQSLEAGDKLMSAYHSTLPDVFPSQFRRFASLYSTLSEALHNANASSDVIDQAIEDVVDHFRARELYKVK